LLSYGVKRKLQKDGSRMPINASASSSAHRSLPDNLNKTKKLLTQDAFLAASQIPKNAKTSFLPCTYVPVTSNSPNVTQAQPVEYKIKIPHSGVNLNSMQIKDNYEPLKDSNALSKTLQTNMELFTDDIEIKDEEIKEELGFSCEFPNSKQNSTAASSGTVSLQVNSKHAVNKQMQVS
jgi:hypothetical protein